ncbi:MAG: hypothetical protein ACOC44_10450 [Promethearchaeia archaeon]
MKKNLEPKEEQFIKDLADTDTVKKMAEELLDKMETDDMALLIATFILMRLKGAEYHEILYQYIIQHFFHILSKLLITLPGFILKIITDIKFVEIMIDIFGKEVNFKEFFQID